MSNIVTFKFIPFMFNNFKSTAFKYLVCSSVLLFVLSFFTMHASALNASLPNGEEKQLREYVTKLINDGYSLFNNTTITKEDRNKRIEQLLNDNLYLEWMAKYTLGRHRRTISEIKIAEFVDVYSKFVIKAYVNLTQHYNGEKTKLKSIKQFDDDMFLVYMEIVKSGNNSPIRVDYLVHQIETSKGSKFMIADIITEGISILNSQQAEFNTVLANEGIDGLIEDLQEKIAANPSSVKKIRY